jgi:hypothetical protein
MNLVCLECERAYDIPKSLPCGYAICSRCEKNMQDLDQANFLCKSCKNRHEIPKSGFERNLFLEKFLVTNGFDNSLKNRCSNLLIELDKTIIKLNEIFEKVDKYGMIVKTRFEHLRYEVDISTESLLEKINKYRDELVKEINEHESRQISEIQQNFNDDFIKELNDMKNDSENLKMLLKAEDLDEIKLTSTTDKIEELKKNSEEKKEFVFLKTSTETLGYVESTFDFDKSVIGKLIKVSNADFDVQRLKSFGRLKINYNIKYREIESSLVSINDNKDFVLFIKSRHTVGTSFSYGYQLRLYNNHSYTTKTLDSTINFLHISLDMIFTCKDYYKIITYDFNFNIVKQFYFSFSLVGMFVTKNKELIITSSTMPVVHILGEDMIEKIAFGQSDSPNRPYYIPSKNVRIQNELIYVCCKDELRILYEETGKLNRVIKFENDPCYLAMFGNDIKILFVSSNKIRDAKVYDLDKNILLEISLGEIDSIGSVQITDNGFLIVNDESNYLLYVN